MRPMIEQMFVGANRASAQTAVNNILPSLGRIPPAIGTATPSSSMTGTTTPVGTAQANSAASELSSNLSICTSPASLRSILASSPAVAIMFTSPSCPPCTAIKPFFEDLARRHGSPGSKKRIEFVLVEMGAGAGAEVAKSGEFGGPVQATPTFVFFVRGRKSGECKGADKRELETQVQLLEMEAFPPHPHAQLALPALDKLSHQLSPVTYTAYPPLPTLAEKLSSVLSASSVDAATGETLSKTVIAYLSSLPAPPSPALTSSLSADLISSWIAATKSSLSAISSPSDKFPIVDLLRLALARDAPRLSLQPTFIAFLPSLVSTLASDLDHDSPSRPYLLTSLRLVSNVLVSPILTARLLAADTLSNITRLVIRALLDPEDAKLRAAGAGLAWSVVARVFAARVGEDAAGGRVESGVEHALGGKSEGEIGGGEEWEGEVASAVLEALGKETQSVEVGALPTLSRFFREFQTAHRSFFFAVHRLSATLALLLYQSPFFTEVASLLEVLEAKDVVGRRTETVKELGGADKDAVLAVMKDLETLLSQV